VAVRFQSRLVCLFDGGENSKDANSNVRVQPQRERQVNSHAKCGREILREKRDQPVNRELPFADRANLVAPNRQHDLHRAAMPSRSSSRSCWVSIFGVAFGMDFRNSRNRFVPGMRSQRRLHAALVSCEKTRPVAQLHKLSICVIEKRFALPPHAAYA